MERFDKYVMFVFFFKILFAILAVSHLYFKVKGKAGSETDKKIVYWEERVEFVFIALMSFMLMYLFYPRSTKPIIIDFETKVLLFIFGIITLIGAKWDIFIKESPVFKKVQEVVR
jgi:uncharacterized BrkB/YihY/UPF0761 family membrane protein